MPDQRTPRRLFLLDVLSDLRRLHGPDEAAHVLKALPDVRPVERGVEVDVDLPDHGVGRAERVEHGGKLGGIRGGADETGGAGDGGRSLGDRAVDVDKGDGARSLVVPVLRDADTFDFAGFLGQYEEIIRKVKTNKLAIDDFQGASITLTNPGTIGTVIPALRARSTKRR